VDQVLIRRCQAGDQGAFALLFERYKDLVYRTTYLTLGSAAEAEDILQEVFLQVHRSLDSYDPGRGAFSTWLYRITVNRCLNWRRGLSRTESLEQLDDERLGGAAFASDSYAEDDTVRKALNGLSRKLRVVVVLRYLCDLSYAEIAEITGLPLGTVKSRLNQAIRLLRDDLESEALYRDRSARNGTVTEA
jgi:RNA polymerase sigma-70 factor, ECF subfamily